MLSLLGIAVLPSGLDWVVTSESEESTSSRDKYISKEKTNIFEKKKKLFLR